MQGARSEDIEELENGVAEQVRQYERGCQATGIQQLPYRWRSVIQHKWHCFEGFEYVTVELQWLEHLWDHGNLSETGVVRANEG